MKFRTTAALLTLAMLSGAALAGPIEPFSQTQFDQLTKAGKPVVVDVSATWCPTCKAQKPILERLMRQPAFRNVTLLQVDFDTARSTLREFKVGTQSTLIGFKGVRETARSVGDTTEAGIEGLIRKTLQ